MGPSAGSEPEVQNVMKYVSKIKKNIKFHQSLHAYGQYIVFPWGYTNERIPDYDKLFELGNKVGHMNFSDFFSMLIKISKLLSIPVIKLDMYLFSGQRGII